MSPQRRASLTVGELVEKLADGNVNASDEVRIVFHGKTRKSFNLPAIECLPGIQEDFVIVAFEEFADIREGDTKDPVGAAD